MAEPSSIWAVLLPVIVGGGIATLGGAVGPLLSHLLTARSSIKAKREKEFERVVEAMLEHDHWLDLKKNAVVYGEAREIPYPPIRRAVAAVSLYFPELLSSMRELDKTSSAYQQWMHGAAQRRLRGEISTLNDGMSDAYAPYLQARIAFEIAVAKYAADRKGKV